MTKQNNTETEKEYCLYCGVEVSGCMRSPHDNPMCPKHYNQVYGG